MMTPENINRIIEKVTSGQWVLTIACAFVFAYCAVNGVIQKDTTAAILAMVFASYFQRKRNGETKQ
jgi:hypothetical protein